jgi:TetR/AcrR family transcriptional repressor of bet genes
MIDFKPPISNRNRLACWFAFYGEAKSRPTYMAACTDTDQVNYNAVTNLCQTIIEEGGYENLEPEVISQGLSAMSEGLWLDLLISPHTIDVEKSQETLRTYLRALFPKHFPIAKRADA